MPPNLFSVHCLTLVTSVSCIASKQSLGNYSKSFSTLRNCRVGFRGNAGYMIDSQPLYEKKGSTTVILNYL